MAVAAAAMATGTFGQILRRRHTTEFNRLADVLLNQVLEFMHFLLRIEKTSRHRILEQRVAFHFKAGYFCWFQRLATVLFFLERLALVHQTFVLAARGGIGEEGVNAPLDPAGFEVFKDGFAEFSRFSFKFGGHKIFWPENKPQPGEKSKRQSSGIFYSRPPADNSSCNPAPPCHETKKGVWSKTRRPIYLVVFFRPAEDFPPHVLQPPPALVLPANPQAG